MTGKPPLEQYIQAAISHGQAKLRSDPDTANIQYDVIMKSLDEMRASPQGEHAALVSILDHTYPNVRGWAATHLLKLDPDKALPVLHQLSALPGLIGFGAEMVIKQWNKGKLP